MIFTKKKYIFIIKIFWRIRVALCSIKKLRFNDPIWIVGCGRSGTTWVSQVVNYDGSLREIFEPFHPVKIKDAQFLEKNHYVAAGSNFSQLEKYSNRVFSGKTFHEYTDSEFNSFLYKGILVKDVFAVLFAKWIFERMQLNLRLIYLIRNPFSVALSTYKARDWIWMTNPIDLLNQKHLYNDFLSSHAVFIKKIANKDDYILNQILIWSIVNGVAISQLEPTTAKIVFYENILKNPKEELQDLISYARDKNILNDPLFNIDIVTKRSATSTKNSSLLNSKSPISTWKDELSDVQYQQGQLILDYFGLSNLYDENGMPNADMLRLYKFPKTSKY